MTRRRAVKLLMARGFWGEIKSSPGGRCGKRTPGEKNYILLCAVAITTTYCTTLRGKSQETTRNYR